MLVYTKTQFSFFFVTGKKCCSAHIFLLNYFKSNNLYFDNMQKNIDFKSGIFETWRQI